MSTWYLIMVPRMAPCEECGGRGEVDSGDDEVGACVACDGRGSSGEMTWEPHNRHLIGEPGQARGVIKRAQKPLTVHDRGPSYAEEGKTFRILAVDTDVCEPVDDRWTLDRKFELATERALFWADRALALQPQVSSGLLRGDAGERVTVATDAILAGRLDDAREILAGVRPEEPRLDAAELEIVRLALDAVVRLGGPDGPGLSLGAQAHLLDEPQVARARAVLAKLDACAVFDEIHRWNVHGAADTVESLARWAAGAEGSRRCFRDPQALPPVASGWAWTACGDLVPAPAATDDPARVACPTCERVAATYSASLA